LFKHSVTKVEVKVSTDEPFVVATRFVNLHAREDAERIAREVQMHSDAFTLLHVGDFGESDVSHVSVVPHSNIVVEKPLQETRTVTVVEESNDTLDIDNLLISSSNAIASAPQPGPKVEGVNGQWKVTFLLTLLDLTTGDFGDEHWLLLKESLSSSAGITLEQVFDLFLPVLKNFNYYFA